MNSLNIGGSEKVAMDSINALDPEKYVISIISLSLFNPEKSILKITPLNAAVETFYFNFEHDHDYSLTGYLRYSLRKKESFNHFPAINELVNRINPNIIHFHTNPRELILHRFFDRKVPAIFTDHSLRVEKDHLGFVKSNLLSLVQRSLYKGFEVIAVSEGIKKNLQERRIVPTKKNITVISNAIDVNFFRKQKDWGESKELAAIYVSRIEPTKGHEDLIKAWALLKDIANKKLYIVGPDGMNGKIQKLAYELECSSTIEFTGATFNPRALLEKSNIGIFPSYKEGLPLSLLEKMAMELPVIVSDIPQLTSIIQNEKNGLVFKTGNTVELAEKIRYLHKHPEHAKTMGKEARATVTSLYNLADNIKKLETVYTKILN